MAQFSLTELEGKVASKTITKLHKSARELAEESPGQSRYLMSMSETLQLLTGAVVKKKNQPQYCKFCGTFLKGENFSVNISPKIASTKKIRRLLQKESQSVPLSSNAQHLIDRYKNSKSRVVTLCKTCNKRSSVKMQRALKSVGSISEIVNDSSHQGRAAKRKRIKKQKKKQAVQQNDNIVCMIPSHSTPKINLSFSNYLTPKTMFTPSPKSSGKTMGSSNRKSKKRSFYHSQLSKTLDNESRETPGKESTGLGAFLSRL